MAIIFFLDIGIFMLGFVLFFTGAEGTPIGFILMAAAVGIYAWIRRRAQREGKQRAIA